MRILVGALVISFLVLVPLQAHAQKAGDGARLAREALIRAQAEKERNDRIVEKQRAAERAAKKAREDTKALQDACRKARTC